MLRFALAVGLMLLAASPAQAAKEWIIDTSKSSLGFAGTASGKAFTGKFGSFNAHVDFDPQHPDPSRIEVTINMQSAKTGDAQKDNTLPGEDWFDIKTFKQANFYGVRVRQKAPQFYVVEGKLTLKDVTRDIELPFSIVPEGKEFRIQGEVTVNRLDYHVGEGEWVDNDLVGKEVKIKVDLLAHPKPEIQ